MNHQTIYFDADDADMDGNGWNVVDTDHDTGVAARFGSLLGATAFCAGIAADYTIRMDAATVREVLPSPDVVQGSEYRAVHAALMDSLESWDAAANEDVHGFVAAVVAEMRESLDVIAERLGVA